MPELQFPHNPSTTPSGLFLIVLRFGAIFCGMNASAGATSLQWDPNPDGNIAGYIVHYGTDSGQLTEIRDVGDTTSFPLTDLLPGKTYYLAVQAYNTSGAQSPLSDVITHTMRADSGVVRSASGESMPASGGEVPLGIVNLGGMGEERTFTFTNNGAVALNNVTFTFGGESAADFRLMGNPNPSAVLASILRPGAKITFSVVFSPSGPGLREATLRLTADESVSPYFETNLSGNGGIFLDQWLLTQGASGDAGDDADGDALSNLIEYAFGTNPAEARGTTVAVGAGGLLASRGTPGVRVRTAPALEFRGVFARRKDHGKVGLIYQTQFSADLKTWVNSTATPVLEGQDDEIEALSVGAPASISGMPPRFFRVGVIEKGKLRLPEWLAAHGAGGGTTGNPDGDGLNNLFEFAFGTDPAKPESKTTTEVNGLLAARGAPAVRILREPAFKFSGQFCRRKDRASHGLVYRPQFSADLKSWVNSPHPEVVSASDGEIEVVSVEAPGAIDGKPARFFRLGVSIAP